jgi:hypothetical protein
MSRISVQNPNLPERANGSRLPINGNGERTARQSGPAGGFGGIGDVPIIATGHEFVSRRPGGVRSGAAAGMTAGLPPCPPPTYETWRLMARDPTIALACAVVWGPLLGSNWSYRGTNDTVPDEWIEFAREVYSPFEALLKTQMLKGLNMGCRSFEQVYGARLVNNALRIVVAKFKPLRWERTFPLVDAATGAYAGLRNGQVELDPEETPPASGSSSGSTAAAQAPRSGRRLTRCGITTA